MAQQGEEQQPPQQQAQQPPPPQLAYLSSQIPKIQAYDGSSDVEAGVNRFKIIRDINGER